MKEPDERPVEEPVEQRIQLVESLKQRPVRQLFAEICVA